MRTIDLCAILLDVSSAGINDEEIISENRCLTAVPQLWNKCSHRMKLHIIINFYYRTCSLPFRTSIIWWVKKCLSTHLPYLILLTWTRRELYRIEKSGNLQQIYLNKFALIFFQCCFWYWFSTSSGSQWTLPYILTFGAQRLRILLALLTPK